jgi:FAD synthase
LAFIRPELRFTSVEDLVTAMHQDIEQARALSSSAQ